MNWFLTWGIIIILKKIGNWKTKPAKVTSVLKVDITTMAIVFTISKICINKIVQECPLQQRNTSWFHSVLRVERTFCVHLNNLKWHKWKHSKS